MDVLEFEVQVHPDYGLGALLTLRAIDLSKVDNSAKDKEPEADDLPDPFDPDNASSPAVESSSHSAGGDGDADPHEKDANGVAKCLQVDKLQPRGACESAGIQIGDVVLRVRAKATGAKWTSVTSHAQLKSVYQKQKTVEVAVARDREFAAAQAAAAFAVQASATGSPSSAGKDARIRRTSSGILQPVMMSQVETEAEQRTKELLDSGTITQEEYDSIIAKTRQRRAEQQQALARAAAIRSGNVIVEAKFGKGSPLGITLYAKGNGPVTLKSFSGYTRDCLASSPRASRLLVPNNEMQVYRVNRHDVRDMDYQTLKDYIRQEKKKGDIYIQFARPDTAADAEIVSISLRRATRADAFLEVLSDSRGSAQNSGDGIVNLGGALSPSSSVSTSTEIDLPRLRALAFEGIPDNDVIGGLRAKVWKVLLDYLPPNKTHRWAAEQDRARRLYQQLVDEYWLDPRIFEPEKGTPQSMLELAHAEGLKAEAAKAKAKAAAADTDTDTDGGGGGDNGNTSAQETPSLLARKASFENVPEVSRPRGISEWTQEEFDAKLEAYKADGHLRFEVHKDVVRTHPGLQFFNMNPERRMTLKRILFIYAKLNPRVSYVQGMNEILAPIYYVIAQDPAFSLSARAKTARLEAAAPNFDEAGESDKRQQQQQPQDGNVDGSDNCSNNDDDDDGSGGGEAEGVTAEGVTQELLDRWAEADTFNCFSNIMVEVCDLFTREMDSGSSGITGQLKNFDEIFHRACPSLAAHFDSLKVEPQFYAFRWLTTLGTRELELPDVVRLWDSLLADENRFRFLDYFCVALVLTRYDELMDKDFSRVLAVLQERTPCDFNTIFNCAKRLHQGEVIDPRAAQMSPKNSMQHLGDLLKDGLKMLGNPDSGKKNRRNGSGSSGGRTPGRR